jgi:hypothetical protein
MILALAIREVFGLPRAKRNTNFLTYEVRPAVHIEQGLLGYAASVDQTIGCLFNIATDFHGLFIMLSGIMYKASNCVKRRALSASRGSLRMSFEGCK